ncbi:Alpha/Beta hydrolase protein [Aspergillus carlsbadensis]|nr:Alpha/Beta hydrolase protein [Aspergillus carlsbadensis]
MAFPQTSDLNPPYRPSVHPQKVNAPLQPAPDLKYESYVLDDAKTHFEKDVAIPMHDGVNLYANIYRPISSLHNKTPTLVFFAPFGKHGAVPPSLFKNMGVDFDRLSKYTQWELPDPLLWCGQWGYSFVQVDPRGTWWSEGEKAHYFSPEEGRDGFDVVEWVAQQSWSTGKVGWGAVSYYAMSSYQAAVLKPPHLAAIMAWEGISDIYREVNCIGGIPTTPFQHFWMNLTGNGLGQAEDHAVLAIEHPLFDDLWQSKVADWSKIDQPLFSVTGWSSLGLHLRGTIAAWREASSRDKYLFVHAGREWSEYYSSRGIEKQKAFWDHFLKGTDNEVPSWKPVEIDVRDTVDVRVRRQELDFPPPRARISSLFLHENGTLSAEPSPSSRKPSYIS